MAQLVLFIGLISIVALNFAQSFNDKIESNIKVFNVPNSRNFLLKNRSVRLATYNETLTSNSSPNIRRLYKIGQRVESDRLLDTQSDSHQWSHPKYVRTTLRYPGQGSQAANVITYLEIICNQSTPIGQAYVVSGGVGKEHIAVVIEAPETLYFSYKIEVYGFSNSPFRRR